MEPTLPSHFAMGVEMSCFGWQIFLDFPNEIAYTGRKKALSHDPYHFELIILGGRKEP
jgi:hypothetical protein